MDAIDKFLVSLAKKKMSEDNNYQYQQRIRRHHYLQHIIRLINEATNLTVYMKWINSCLYFLVKKNLLNNT